MYPLYKQFTIFALALMLCASLYGSPPVKLSDEQLRTAIVGVWFSEELPQMMRHIAERMQYFPDGRFVGDYRISTPSSEHYIRNAGTWKVSGGQFSEATDKCSEPGVNLPTLVRHGVVMDHTHMIIETADGTRSELWRCEFPLEKNNRTVSSVDHKKAFFTATTDARKRLSTRPRRQRLLNDSNRHSQDADAATQETMTPKRPNNASS